MCPPAGFGAAAALRRRRPRGAAESRSLPSLLASSLDGTIRRAELPELIRGLLEPAAYPHPVDTVELVQTHISYVFLAGDFVYKVKKPVDFGFLNFTTLARRRYYCRREAP